MAKSGSCLPKCNIASTLEKSAQFAMLKETNHIQRCRKKQWRKSNKWFLKNPLIIQGIDENFLNLVRESLKKKKQASCIKMKCWKTSLFDKDALYPPFCCTGYQSTSRGSQARERNKMYKNWKIATKSLLFTDDMFV